MPFTAYHNQDEFFKTYCKEQTVFAEHVARTSRGASEACEGSRIKIYEFLKQYSSPSKLLEVSSEFEQHFPEDWFDPDFQEITIADVLKGGEAVEDAA